MDFEINPRVFVCIYTWTCFNVDARVHDVQLWPFLGFTCGSLYRRYSVPSLEQHINSFERANGLSLDLVSYDSKTIWILLKSKGAENWQQLLWKQLLNCTNLHPKLNVCSDSRKLTCKNV